MPGRSFVRTLVSSSILPSSPYSPWPLLSTYGQHEGLVSLERRLR